jgi:ribokinase
MDVLVFGSISMDLTTYVPKLPRLGETLRGSAYITVPGGKGDNQAVAAARIGAKTAFIGRVGDDQFGEEVIRIVGAERVDVSGLIKDPDHDTGLAVISVDDHADNAIIIISGANMAMDESDIRRAEITMEAVKVVLLQLEIPAAISIAAAKKAKEKGALVVFDPAPAAQLPDDAFQFFDFITPNEIETEALVGFYPTDRQKAAAAAKLLRERGARTAIIKMGAQGVYFEGPDQSGFIPAFRVEAIDTVAAGDAFNGGLAAALVEGLPLAEAVRWAAAAGAIATTKKGAMPAMPFRAEVLALLEK